MFRHIHQVPLAACLIAATAFPSLAQESPPHAADALEAEKPSALPSNWIKSIGLRLMAWADTCADYYAAAAMYEQLSGLSDAELARRGLSRATLAHDVCTASDRNAKRERNGACARC